MIYRRTILVVVIVLIVAQIARLYCMVPNFEKNDRYRLTTNHSQPFYPNSMYEDSQRLIVSGDLWDGRTEHFELEEICHETKTISYNPVQDLEAEDYSVTAHYEDGNFEVLFMADGVMQDELYGFTIKEKNITHIDFQFGGIVRTLSFVDTYSEVYIRSDNYRTYWGVALNTSTATKHNILILFDTEISYDLRSKELMPYLFSSTSPSGKSSILRNPKTKKYYYWLFETQQLIEIQTTNSDFQPQFITEDDKYVYDVVDNTVIFYDPFTKKEMVHRVAEGKINLYEKTLRWISSDEFVVCGFENYQFWSFSTVHKYNIRTHQKQQLKKWRHFFSTKYYDPEQYTWIEGMGFVCFEWARKEIIVL